MKLNLPNEQEEAALAVKLQEHLRELIAAREEDPEKVHFEVVDGQFLFYGDAMNGFVETTAAIHCMTVDQFLGETFRRYFFPEEEKQ